MASKKPKGSNFQFASSGRGSDTKTFVVKVRGPKLKGKPAKTESVNVRCGSAPTEACQAAQKYAREAMEKIREAQETDEERKREALRAAKRKSSKAPF